MRCGLRGIAKQLREKPHLQAPLVGSILKEEPLFFLATSRPQGPVRRALTGTGSLPAWAPAPGAQGPTKSPSTSYQEWSSARPISRTGDPSGMALAAQETLRLSS